MKRNLKVVSDSADHSHNHEEDSPFVSFSVVRILTIRVADYYSRKRL